jgi:predicted transcriptional regulator
MGDEGKKLVGLTADIVANLVGRNVVATADLPALIRVVHSALSELGHPSMLPKSVLLRQPAVPIHRSVTPDYIVCLEDGLKFKSLKRHLWAKFGFTPQAYRERWGLAPDYPMVSANYAKARAALARHAGLGKSLRPARNRGEP